MLSAEISHCDLTYGANGVVPEVKQITTSRMAPARNVDFFLHGLMAEKMFATHGPWNGLIACCCSWARQLSS